MKAKGDAPGVRGVGFGLRTGEGGMAARSEEEEEEEDDDDDDACASPFCFFSGDSATGASMLLPGPPSAPLPFKTRGVVWGTQSSAKRRE